MIRGLLAFAAFLAIMGILICSAQFSAKCDAAGGEMVRGAVWWKCVAARECPAPAVRP